MKIFLKDSMGNSTSAQKLNFEDIQTAINRHDVIIISTLSPDKQVCLIKNTLLPTDETNKMNELMKNISLAPLIIIYGENSSDDTVSKKYIQLIRLGFKKVAIYCGGLFEWLLLNDIYGTELFPIDGTVLDILAYKGKTVCGK